MAQVNEATIERIDDAHANATAAWHDMATPDTLGALQVEKLEQASMLIKEPLLFSISNHSVFFDTEIPPQGTVLITLKTG